MSGSGRLPRLARRFRGSRAHPRTRPGRHVRHASSAAGAGGRRPERPLRAEELEMDWLRGCDVLHLSGYALLARPIDEAGAKAAGAARMRGGRISVDLGAAAAIREFGPDRLLSRLEQLEPDVVFAREEE